MFFGGFIGSLLLIAVFVMGLNARGKIKGLNDRLQLVEEGVDEIRQGLRLLKAATGSSQPAKDGPDVSRELESQPAPPTSVTPAATPPPAKAAASSVPTVTSSAARSDGAGSLPPSPPPGPAATTPSQPPASGSLEERLGTQWAVWAGGVALALGGLFLVRYSIEAGLIGPEVRIFLGALLAAALIAAGEWMRRGEIKLGIENLPDAHIPSVLTAAGTVIAFGTIYAAYALYAFIGPTAAFVLLGATGIGTMLASALHGPALAGLGLAGSFLAPILVSTSTPRFWPLTIYLAAVTASAYLLARTRGWLWLAIAGVAGAVLWSLMMTGSVAGPRWLEVIDNTNATMAHIGLQLALAAGFLAYEPNLGGRDETAAPDWIANGALIATALVALVFLAAVPFDYWGWLPLVIASVTILTATGWLTAPAALAISLAGVVALAALALWPGLYMPPDKSLLMPAAAHLLRLPDHISNYMTIAALLTLAPAGIAGYRIWRGPLLPDLTAALYALAATVPPVLALILAYLRITQFDTSISFAFGGLILALGFAYGASTFQKADQAYSVPAYNLACGAFASAAIAGLAFALVVTLSRGYLTVALALSALGTAYLSTLRDIPLLRVMVTALGALVAARIAWDPRIMGDGVGTTPIFNWLLIGYAVPAASFWGAARLLEKKGENLSVRLCDALAVALTSLLAFFEIRHLTNNGDVYHRGTGHVEAGLLTLTSLTLSFILARMNFAKKNPVFDAASIILGAGSIAFAVFGLAGAANPYFSGDEVGGRTVFSSLLTAYLIPGLAALFVARHARENRPAWYVRAAGILGVALIFLYVTLEVRHTFQGATIAGWQETFEPERWAYSAAWLVLGIVFLAFGLLRGSLEARLASAVLIVLAAVKVTIFDLAGIGGLWRALSFLCLGAVLIGIGLVYQKFVFAPPAGR